MLMVFMKLDIGGLLLRLSEFSDFTRDHKDYSNERGKLKNI